MIHVVELDEGVVMQLASMGFDIEGCKRAVFHTHNQGTVENAIIVSWYRKSIFSCTLGVEPAMQWVLEHMGDPGMILYNIMYNINPLSLQVLK